MLKSHVEDRTICIGKHVRICFQRTLRIADDGRDSPLPPGLGAFPVHRVEDYLERVPRQWAERGGYFIPMYQREAMWISFEGACWRPNAVKIGVGSVNAVSGQPWDLQLRTVPQDYVVIPDQPWLDGINAGEGFIRQFVAMPLGSGHTVEGQVAGKEEVGGLQIAVFEPNPGVFPDKEPGRDERDDTCCCMSAIDECMGLTAGGRMRQEIYEDEYGFGTWSHNVGVCIHIHIVNSVMYEKITGEAPPPSPIDAQTYAEHGYPWFELYDETKRDVKPSETLAGVKSIHTLDMERTGGDITPEASVDIDPKDMHELRLMMGPEELTGK